MIHSAVDVGSEGTTPLAVRSVTIALAEPARR